MPNQITQVLEALKNCKTALLSVDGLRFGWEISQAEEAIAALSSAAPSAAEPVALCKAFSLLDRMPINEGYHDEIVETLDALRAALAASQPAPVEAQPVPEGLAIEEREALICGLDAIEACVREGIWAGKHEVEIALLKALIQRPYRAAAPTPSKGEA